MPPEVKKKKNTDPLPKLSIPVQPIQGFQRIPRDINRALVNCIFVSIFSWLAYLLKPAGTYVLFCVSEILKLFCF